MAQNVATPTRQTNSEMIAIIFFLLYPFLRAPLVEDG